MSFTKHGEIGPVPMKPSIQHFTHPGHSLTAVYGSEEFQCDGCKTPGNGPRYQCHICNFNMHKDCGVCPSTLSTFMHPQHQLKLVMRYNERFCNLCRDAVEGLFYQCTICDFNIHPLCTKLPEYVPHALHPIHSLKLQTSSSGWCRVCKSECTSWRYGCRICSFDIDLECILAAYDTPTTSRSMGAPTPPPQLPPYDIASPLPPWGVYGGLPPWGVGGGLPPWGVGGGLPPWGVGGGLPPWGVGGGLPPWGVSGGLPPWGVYGPLHPYHSLTPPPYNWPSPTPFSAYAPPPPSSSVVPPPASGFHAHGVTPYFGPHNSNNQAQGSGIPSKGRLSKIINAFVGNLSIGVAANMIVAGLTGLPTG